MFGFFGRYHERQPDLAAGADAALVASNRKKARRGVLVSWGGLWLLLASGSTGIHDIVQQLMHWLAAAA